ncbi:unnamed protein product [Closterium sp. Naga37s-1]|nr:unnamed protein product [Closterium sp. Naga37s-1]
MATIIGSRSVRPVVNLPDTKSSSRSRLSESPGSCLPSGGFNGFCGSKLKPPSTQAAKQRSSGPFCCFANASWMEDDFVPQPSFAHRLSRAWQVVFPTRRKGPSVAEVAKERLRLVLYSDREEFHPRLKKKLCGDIVNAMGDFLDVAVEDEDDVIFRVTRDPVVGSIYNVSVPVKRVKPALQKAS